WKKRWYGDEFSLHDDLVQTNVFPVAANAFLKSHRPGPHPLLPLPHGATALVPILYYPFPTEPHPGPQTQKEHYTLAVIYALMLLLTMLFRSAYNTQGGNDSVKAKDGEMTQLRPRMGK
uniref:Uncharacterized protein n=1 Tax=Salmo trutta TaxID=8032 RepID=A0A673VWT3_SALTR